METQNKLQLPTETVELPSKGLLYPPESPLASGTIEMKYMTAKEEDILSNQNYIKQGTVFDKLLTSLIVSKVDYNDLLIGDKNAIMIAARVLGYGKEYEVKMQHPITGEEEKVVIDLSQLKNKQVDTNIYKPGVNEFNFTLPASKNDVTFKILTHRDEMLIEQELKGLKKVNLSGEVTTRLKHCILAVNGDRDKKTVRDFVDNYLLATDARALRAYMKEVTPDLDLTFTFVGSDGYTQEGVDVPIGLSFFYPSTGV
jgi:hypothetical protein